MTENEIVDLDNEAVEPMSLEDQLALNQKIAFDEKMAKHTLVGNLTNWRTNFGGVDKEFKRKQQILSGYFKIQNLMSRLSSS